MEFDTATWWLAALLLGGLTAVCWWMLKRTSEKNDKVLEELRANMVQKGDYEKDLDTVEMDIRAIQRDYTPRAVHDKDFDECRKDIKQISENYLTKEDFFREQAKTDRKLDQILDLLMKQGGGAK